MISQTFTLRNLALAAALTAATALAGCSTDELAMEDQYLPNSGSEQFPIVVEKGPTTLNVAGGKSLTPNQINAVSSFARQAAAGGATPVTVSRPSGASPRLAHEVANLVAQQGVPAGMIHMASYKGAANGPVKITYKKVQARTTPCGEWPADMTETSQNTLNYNHGCAVQSNIAAMVADPSVFNTPAPATPATAASRIAGITAVDTSAQTALDSSGTGGSSSSGASSGNSAGGGSGSGSGGGSGSGSGSGSDGGSGSGSGSSN